MPIITETYVKSLNGYAGTRPFTGEDGIVFAPEIIPDGDGDYKAVLKPEIKNVTLDGYDIHMNGGTGSTVPEEAQSVASGLQMLELQPMEEDGDFRMRIGNYPLTLVTESG